ncbi:ATP-binding protein [Jatrophihabitans telluris]|uniref:histidine kinase n=1 Tax=Jatrophihabitans telluris TaxID=2038343 RepID=A0ABY4R3F5_9ACTN|nr:ATP-binding protein [Jatrophihabitans telluris]UQX89559.1 ATP-binding protein [Jatrophihabitans telluris]
MNRRTNHSLDRLAEAITRLADGDIDVALDAADGPPAAQSITRAVNTMAVSARAAVAAERDAEQFRQRTRLISATIRRTANVSQMADQLVRGIGHAYEVDRCWLHTFDERVPDLTAQWHTERLTPLPASVDALIDAHRDLAVRLWENARVLAVEDHRGHDSSEAGTSAFDLAGRLGASASVVVPIGDSVGVFGLLWISMVDHPRHWTPAELGVAQHLAADLAHSLVQAHIIDQQEQAVQLLRELDQAKSDFVSTVSHELRTPLTSITGYLELLRDGDGGPLPAAAQQMLDVIDRNATRLRNLIEDLLTQSRIDAGRLRLELGRVDVVAALQTVRTALLPLASAGVVTVHAVEADRHPLPVDADIHQLEQVFTNLLSNAIKFSPPGSEVTVSCGPDPEGTGVFVQVRDTGIGIPEAEFDRLFSRFFRASNAAAAALPGTGLGLSIVDEIVRRHGGAIEAESKEGVGTIFTVWLPNPPGSPDSPD